jgi:hypothetical protein
MEENLHTTFKNKLEGLYGIFEPHQNLVMILLGRSLLTFVLAQANSVSLFLDLQLKECTYDQSQILNS